MEENDTLDLNLIIELMSADSPYGRMMFTESMLTNLKLALIHSRDNRQPFGYDGYDSTRVIS
jgi:hypothetical protein